MAGLMDFLQSASNSAASNVSAPVDGLAWLLRKAGVPVPQNPLLGSDWMAEKGLTKPVAQSAAGLLGETAGMLSPMLAAAKAPQIAKGLLQMGDNLAAPQMMNRQAGAIDPAMFGLPINKDGTVSLYHGTTKDAAQQIVNSRRLVSAGEPDVYMTTAKNVGYGDGTNVRVNVDPKKLFLDDEFPGGRLDFRMPTRNGQAQVSGASIDNPFVYPQDKALATAQANAAKSLDDGGLGLAVDNTPAERARALGYQTAPSKEMFHSARGGWENSIVDPAKSDLGFHLGSLEQAENRAKAFGQGGVNFGEGANVMPVMTDKYANFLKVNDTGTFHADGIALQLEKKGLLAKGKGKQIEKEIDGNFRLREQYDPLMRDALARNDFDGVKYANQQEGSGLSYAVTNPAVVRSRFAAFDPARRNEADLLGRADPALLGLLGAGVGGGAAYYNSDR